MSEKKSAGIDISKDTLEMAIYPAGESLNVPYDSDGMKQIAAALKVASVDIVVLEATGGFEVPLVSHLAQESLPAVVVNPRQVRRFAQAKGVLAKTDRLDAKVLAEFGAKINVEITPLPDESMATLKELARRRRQVVKMITAEQNRLVMTHSQSMKVQIERHIRFLRNDLDTIDKATEMEIKKTSVWKAKADLLTTIPGISTRTSTHLISRLPELGTLNRKEIAALVGLAPMNNDSGKSRKHRRIIGGRKDVRSALYMPTLAATRFNPVIRQTYNRLVEKGKPKQVAVTACMRKIIVTANAMLRDGVPWTPPNAPSEP
jgi:transposase